MKSCVSVSAASGAPTLAAAFGGGMVPARPELIPGLIMSPAVNFGLSPAEKPAFGSGMDGSRLAELRYGGCMAAAALKAAVMGPGWLDVGAEGSCQSELAKASRVGVGRRRVGEVDGSQGVEEKLRFRAGDSGGGSIVEVVWGLPATCCLGISCERRGGVGCLCVFVGAAPQVVRGWWCGGCRMVRSLLAELLVSFK